MEKERCEIDLLLSTSLVEKGYAYASARVGEIVKMKFERALMRFTCEGNCLFYFLHDVHDHGMAWAWLGHIHVIPVQSAPYVASFSTIDDDRK